MPPDLVRATTVEALAQRYRKLPREVEDEGTALMRHVSTVRLAEKQA